MPVPDEESPIELRPELVHVDETEELVELEVVEEAIVLEEAEPDPEPPPVPPREIVLIGAGHAHLQIVQWWRKRPLPGVRMTLVSAFDRAAYSGMLAGVIAGQFEPEEMLIDLPGFCARSNVNLIVDRAIRLDPVARTIELAHQPALPFDVASINIGSVPAQEQLWQTHRMLLSVKPMATLWQRFLTRQKELLTQWREADLPRRLQFAVVGAGAAGVEIALCLEERIHNEDLPIDVHLVDAAHEVWRTASRMAIHRTRKLLKYRGIELHLGQRVVDCDEDGPSALVFEDGSRLRCDLALWATAAAPPAVLQGFNLPLSERGFVLVDRALQTSSGAPIFAVGDTADFPIPIPKAGVYAVRQGPILWHNLRAVLSGKPLRAYHPQRGFLALLGCGDGTAILDYKGWSIRSRWAWSLKCGIDRAFVRRFR